MGIQSNPTVAEKYSLIPACDLDPAAFKRLIKGTARIREVSAYKVGFRLGLELGLPEVVRMVRGETDKPVIYDHQKAATDIPDTAAIFADVCAQAGIDTVILFPLTGPIVLEQWVHSCNQRGLKVMVGGIMSHPGFLESERGFIHEQAPAQIYTQAAELGVREFVVPATRVDYSWGICEMLRGRGVEPIFYSPGIGTQGGRYADLRRPEGPAWHAIVGRSLFAGENYQANATALMG